MEVKLWAVCSPDGILDSVFLFTLNSYCNFIGLAYTSRRSAKVECGCGGAAAVRRPHPTPHSRRHTTIQQKHATHQSIKEATDQGREGASTGVAIGACTNQE